MEPDDKKANIEGFRGRAGNTTGSPNLVRSYSDPTTPTLGEQEDVNPQIHRVPSASGSAARRASSSKGPAADPARPPRPMNAWLLFRSDKVRQLKHENPGLSTPQGELSKIVASIWRDEAEEVKRHYEHLAEKEKIEHAKRYPDYKFRYKSTKSRSRHQLPSFHATAASSRGETASLPSSRSHTPSPYYEQSHDYGYEPPPMPLPSRYSRGFDTSPPPPPSIEPPLIRPTPSHAYPSSSSSSNAYWPVSSTSSGLPEPAPAPLTAEPQFYYEDARAQYVEQSPSEYSEWMPHPPYSAPATSQGFFFQSEEEVLEPNYNHFDEETVPPREQQHYSRGQPHYTREQQYHYQ